MSRVTTFDTFCTKRMSVKELPEPSPGAVPAPSDVPTGQEGTDREDNFMPDTS